MITLFWTVMFCLGWNLTLQEYQIFHFLKRPFEDLFDKIQAKKEYIKSIPYSNYQKSLLNGLKLKYFILKPLILCITCMASVWGASIFILLNGISLSLLPYLILNSVAASFIQTFIWSLYVRHIQ